MIAAARIPGIGAITAWLAQRTPRERWLLALGCALALVWAGVAGIWQPLAAHRDRLTETTARYDRALDALQTLPPPGPAVSADNRPVPVILTESAAAFGLVIRRLEPEGRGARLTLDEAPFDSIILWLAALEQDHGLRVTAGEMARRPAPGTVSASLAVER